MKYILALMIIVVSAIGLNAEENVAGKVQTYLNSITTMKANFSQLDAEGNISGGQFFLQRPGKFRWEYDKRQPILIVSDGSQLVYYDKELKEATYTTVENTLANFLAEKTIKFSGDVKLVDSGKKDGRLFVEVTQISKPDDGKLKMIFSENPMQIEGLEITDANGYVTKVSFSNQVFGTNIAQDTFRFKDPKRVKDAWDKKR